MPGVTRFRNHRNRRPSRPATPPPPAPLVEGGEARSARDLINSALIVAGCALVGVILFAAAGWLRTAVQS
jgi:hypothetical protein